MSARSAPAAIALTVSCPGASVTAPMLSASVTATPSKPTSSRSASYTSGLSVAGTSSAPGSPMCPTSVRGTPASVAARKGSKLSPDRSSSDSSDTGSSSCESTVRCPWPGKCLAAEARPLDVNPSTAASTTADTRSGSSPGERTLMTGSSAPIVRSATGEKFRVKPRLRRSADCARIASRVMSASFAAPAAMSGGKSSAAPSSRATGPPSWSTPIATGHPRSPAASARVVVTCPTASASAPSSRL